MWSTVRPAGLICEVILAAHHRGGYYNNRWQHWHHIDIDINIWGRP